jgi:hypothetical protein
VTLKVDASGYARSLGATVQVAKNATSSGMDLMLLPTARVDELNAMGGARVNDYGVIGIELQSAEWKCDPEGGQITLAAMPLAKVVYSQANSSIPDPSLTSVQTGAHPAAWIVGVVPPGAYYQPHFSKTGCTERAMPMEWEGRTYSGHLPLESKAFSNGVLFFE